MEMNTRLQVEHPVTELVTGLDLVEWQFRVAAGEPLGVHPGRHHPRRARHRGPRLRRGSRRAGSCPPAAPSSIWSSPPAPASASTRACRSAASIGSDYDPMLSKVIAHGADRASALRRLDRALADTHVLGVTPTSSSLRYLLADPDVVAGDLDTGLLDRRLDGFDRRRRADGRIAAAASAARRRTGRRSADLAPGRAQRPTRWDIPTGWRVGAPAPTTQRLQTPSRSDHVHITGSPRAATVRIEDGPSRRLVVERRRHRRRCDHSHRRRPARRLPRRRSTTTCSGSPGAERHLAGHEARETQAARRRRATPARPS